MTTIDTTSTQGNLQAWTLVLGRALLAAIFILSGIAKITDISGTAAYIASVGLPLPTLGVILAIVVELIGGIALLVGFQTRLAALAIAAFSVVAAVAFHNNLADQMQMIMFMKNLAIAGGLLFVAVFGPGRISFDRH